MDRHDATRYTLELHMLERDGTLGSVRAVELLRSEFARALNASYLAGLSGGDIELGAVWRSIPREGAARYAVELLLQERDPEIGDEQAAALVQREFQHAQNALHFLRIAREDFSARLVARTRVRRHESLRAA